MQGVQKAHRVWAWAAVLSLGSACSAGAGGQGTTSVSITPDRVQSVPEAPISTDPVDAGDVEPGSDLPIVPNPPLPGNVPFNTVWINPSPEVAFDITGPRAFDVFYNQLGSVSMLNELAAIVQTNPNFIVDHVALIGRSLYNRRVYNVTLYDPATSEPVIIAVDDLLLATPQRVLLDGVPLTRDKLSKVIWPALYVKALALYLGGYDASFTNSMRIMTGKAYGAIQSVRHQPANVVEPYLDKINSNTPVITSSIAVSQGDALTDVSPDEPNVTVMTQGYVFGCTQVQGKQDKLQICLQANTAHYIISYASGDVRLRATAPHNAGAAFDGQYGYSVDGSTTMPLSAFIALTDQIRTLSAPL